MSPSPVNGILPTHARRRRFRRRATPLLRLRATALFDDAAPLSRATVLFDASTLVRVCRRALLCRDAFRRCCAFRRLTLRHSAAPPACHRPFDAAARFETAAHFNGTGPLTRATALFDDAAPLACRRPFRRRRASLACHRPFRRRRAPPHVPLRASTPPHHFAHQAFRRRRTIPGLCDPMHVCPLFWMLRRTAPLPCYSLSTAPRATRRFAGAVSFSRRPPHSDAAVPFLDVTVFDVAGCLFGTRYCSYRTGHFHAAVCAARLTPATTVSDTAPLRHATCVCHPAFPAGIHGPTT
ncbi:hypothetical protein MSAN_00475700 [Mycena sanguinolenta]|uniref:Uncharacterized protein n=1 Tax=Mycena sanguinolenta TaxID=230812 RepID=A0A8H6ZB70_9AGAR|nr:hypothetical protein MSAN_00475700 [Mycena sanguinolenta]